MELIKKPNSKNNLLTVYFDEMTSESASYSEWVIMVLDSLSIDNGAIGNTIDSRVWEMPGCMTLSIFETLLERFGCVIRKKKMAINNSPYSNIADEYDERTL